MPPALPFSEPKNHLAPQAYRDGHTTCPRPSFDPPENLADDGWLGSDGGQDPSKRLWRRLLFPSGRFARLVCSTYSYSPPSLPVPTSTLVRCPSVFCLLLLPSSGASSPPRPHPPPAETLRPSRRGCVMTRGARRVHWTLYWPREVHARVCAPPCVSASTSGAKDAPPRPRTTTVAPPQLRRQRPSSLASPPVSTRSSLVGAWPRCDAA